MSSDTAPKTRIASAFASLLDRFHEEAARGQYALYRFELVDENPSAWFVTICNDSCRVGEGADLLGSAFIELTGKWLFSTSQKYEIDVSMTEPDCIDMLTGNFNLQRALQNGTIRIKGNVAFLFLFLNVFGLLPLGNEFFIAGKILSMRLQNRQDEADKLLEAAIQSFPDNVSILVEFGWIRIGQQRYQEAEKYFDRALKWEINAEFATHGKLLALRLQKRIYDAAKLLEAATESFPDNVGILTEAGWIRHEQKHYAEARQFFDRALELDAGNGLATQGKIASFEAEISSLRLQELSSELNCQLFVEGSVELHSIPRKGRQANVGSYYASESYPT